MRAIGLLVGLLTAAAVGLAAAQTPDQLRSTADQLRVSPQPLSQMSVRPPVIADTRAMTQAWVDRTNAGTVGIITGGVDGTYVRIGSDLLNILDDDDTLRILPIIGRGSLQNIADMLYLRGVDIAIVQSDILDYTKMLHLYPGIDQEAQYIVRLYNEEVHILARPDIKTLADLQGKPVNIDRTGSGTAMTSLLMFNAFHIDPEWRTDDQPAALEKLRNGDIAAMIYVVGEPARLFAALPVGTDLHFLSVPMTATLANTYDQGVITSVDYPHLVTEDIPTISVSSVMAVYGWTPGSERYRKVARFVDAFFNHFGEFQKPPRHPKWLEVSIMSEVPGWKRFPAATDWLNQHLGTPSGFNAFVAGLPDLGPEMHDHLLAQYKAWQAHREPLPTINVYARKPPNTGG